MLRNSVKKNWPSTQLFFIFFKSIETYLRFDFCDFCLSLFFSSFRPAFNSFHSPFPDSSRGLFIDQALSLCHSFHRLASHLFHRGLSFYRINSHHKGSLTKKLIEGFISSKRKFLVLLNPSQWHKTFSVVLSSSWQNLQVVSSISVDEAYNVSLIALSSS